MTRMRFGGVVMLAMLVGTLSCVTPPDIQIGSVSVSLSSNAPLVGQKVTASVTVKDANGLQMPSPDVQWASRNTSVASVSSSGEVTALAAGSTTITATASGVSGSADLTVTNPSPAPVASVTVSLSTTSLTPGQTTQASATMRDAGGNTLGGRSVAWSSSNTSIATVNGAGVVTAVAVGSAQIIATSEGVNGNATLTVSATPSAPVASVSVSLASSSLNAGQTTQATATTRDANNNVLTGRAMAWSSSNTAVATVNSSGLVTAVAAGTAQITATSEGQSGSATLTVNTPAPAPVASVNVSLASSSLNPGQTTQATATTRDANNNVLTGRTITWASTNSAVATVNSSGVVTAVAVGTAQINATSEGVTNGATLSVVAPPPPPPPGSVEPPGMTVITERAFNSTVEDNWTVPSWAGTNVLSITSDATAPKSPSNVQQIRFPAGFGGGDSPALTERNLGSTASTLYVSMWIKISSNWQGHPTGTNKVLHFWVAGLNRVFVYIDGSGTNILQPYLGLQGIATAYNDGHGSTSTSVNLSPNVAGQTGAQIVRGQWYHWELVLRVNTSGATDGSADWWINGVQVGHYTGIGYVSSGQSRTWEDMKWDPTWGGLGGTIAADQFMWMDHFYMSGKP
jgi:uncharacterized protein YjdB